MSCCKKQCITDAHVHPQGSFPCCFTMEFCKVRETYFAWWRHQMETLSALLAICAGNSPVPGEFPAQRPVTRGFDVFFDLRPDKRLSKQSRGWWFETPSHSLWRHRNGRRCFGLCQRVDDAHVLGLHIVTKAALRMGANLQRSSGVAVGVTEVIATLCNEAQQLFNS